MKELNEIFSFYSKIKKTNHENTKSKKHEVEK